MSSDFSEINFQILKNNLTEIAFKESEVKYLNLNFKDE